jgi:hypothetical protein
VMGGEGQTPMPNLQQRSMPNSWQRQAYYAPRQGGQGSTPNLPSRHGTTMPSPRSGMTRPAVTQGYGEFTPQSGLTPPDFSGGGSPRVLDRIPDSPPPNFSGRARPIPRTFDTQGYKPINEQHINHLMENPHLADYFDQKFGQGASAQFLNGGPNGSQSI